MGQFAHAIRRGVNMVYIVENNGVYGLTKGQFSATADRGSKAKRGAVNNDTSIDLVAMAMQLGATFVARSFSGDKEQLVPIIKAAIEHKGAAFIDVLSPCVAFNNHLGSTKSFDFVRMHNEAVNRLDFITGREPIKSSYEPGTVEIVEQHDGSKIALKKLNSEYNIHDKLAAMSFLLHHAAEGQIVTGLLYVDNDPDDLHRISRPSRRRSMRLARRSCARARRRWSGSTRACANQARPLMPRYQPFSATASRRPPSSRPPEIPPACRRPRSTAACRFPARS